MEQLTATAGAVGSTFVNMGMQVLDGATAGVRGPSAQAEAWRADAMAHQIGLAEARAEIEQLRQSLTRAEGERDAANAAMLRGCKEEIADLVAEKMLAKQKNRENVAAVRKRGRLVLIRDPGLWQPVATDLFKKCLVPTGDDGIVVLLTDLTSAFARSLAVSPLDRRLSHVSHQDLRSFCDELGKVTLTTYCIIEPFRAVLQDLGMTLERLWYFNSNNTMSYSKGLGLKGYYFRCGDDVVCRSLCTSTGRILCKLPATAAAAGGEVFAQAMGAPATAPRPAYVAPNVIPGQAIEVKLPSPAAPAPEPAPLARDRSVVAPFSAAVVVPDGAAVVPDGAAGVVPVPDVAPKKFWGVSAADSQVRPYCARYSDASGQIVKIGNFVTAEEAALAVNEKIMALPPAVRIKRRLNEVVDGKPVPKSSAKPKPKPRKAKAKAPVKKPTVTKAAAKKKASSSRRASECWDNTEERHWVTGVGWKSGPKPVTEPSSRAGRRAALRPDSDSN